jgi:hypothetical protein
MPMRSAAERAATATRLTSERRAKRTGSSSANRASDTVDSPIRKRAMLALATVLLLLGGGYWMVRTFGASERAAGSGSAGSVAPPLPVLPPPVEQPVLRSRAEAPRTSTAAPSEAVDPSAPPVQALEPTPATPAARTQDVPSSLNAPRVAPPAAPRRAAPAHAATSAPAVVAPATEAPPSDGKLRLRDYGGRR